MLEVVGGALGAVLVLMLGLILKRLSEVDHKLDRHIEYHLENP